MNSNNPKLQKIQELILKLAEGDFEVRENVSSDLDEFDTIINGLNMLGEELLALSGKNQQLESFFYKVAHDIKNPLNSINVLLGMGNEKLISSGYKGEALQYFKIAHESTGRVHSLVMDLMELVRLNNQKLPVAEIDFEAIIAPIIQNVKESHKCPDFDVQLNNTLEKKISSYPSAFNSIFQNIIENACKYRRSGISPSLKIEISYIEDGLIIKCQDNGLGINKKFLPVIFEPFQRAIEGIPGSGLGLFIVKTSVEKVLKGKIEISSELNVGTTITIFLPYVFSEN